MPTLAMQCRQKYLKEHPEDKSIKSQNQHITDEFLNLLKIKISEAKDMLIERFQYICS